jgi:sugar phosphate isomerase/epimerase
VRDLSNDSRLLSLNTATVDPLWSLRECIDGCVRHGIGAIGPWRHKLGGWDLREAARIVDDSGLVVSGLCRGGMFPAATAAGRQAAIGDNLRALDEAVALGARCLVLVVGGLPPGSKDIAGARRQVRDGIAALLEHSRAAAMPLAIEPLHPMYAADRACVNTLAQANDLCDDLGEGVGVVVDVYHVWWDPNLEAEIRRAGRAGRLHAFHVSDWLVPTRDPFMDRGMMGDGVIDIRRIRAWMEESGYAGTCEVEIFSAGNWWKRDPDEILRVCAERHRTVV